MKKTLFVILFIGSSFAHAEWKLVSMNDVLDKYYVETKSIQTFNIYKRAWVRHEFNEKTDTNMLSARSYEEYDCKERKMRMLSFEGFKKSNLTDSFGITTKIYDWIFVPPDTSRAAIFSFICQN